MALINVHSDFEAQKNKFCQLFPFFPIYLPWCDGTGCHELSFLNVEFLSQCIHSALSPSSRGSLVPLHFLPLGWYHLHICGIFPATLIPGWWKELNRNKYQGYKGVLEQLMKHFLCTVPVLVVGIWGVSDPPCLWGTHRLREETDKTIPYKVLQEHGGG